MVEEYGTMASEGLEEIMAEGTDIGDLTGVVEQKFLLPATNGVKFKISKSELKSNEACTWRWIALQLTIVDGLPDEETGSLKYKGKVMFQNVCYYADPQKYTSDYFKTKQHLVQFKSLLTSVGIPLTGVKVNDALSNSLVGMEILGNIVQSPETVKNPETGKREKTGIVNNEVKSFKPAV